MNPITSDSYGSRFPMSVPDGRVVPSVDPPSGSLNRPFGMRYGVVPSELDGHGKKPTQKAKKKQTAIYDDGRISGYEEDVEYYTEDDEE